jgi:hypothetical protein
MTQSLATGPLVSYYKENGPLPGRRRIDVVWGVILLLMLLRNIFVFENTIKKRG